MFPLTHADFDSFFGRFGHSLPEVLQHLRNRGIYVVTEIRASHRTRDITMWLVEATVESSWCGNEYWQRADLEHDWSGGWSLEQALLSVVEGAVRSLVGDQPNSYEDGESSLCWWSAD